MRTLISYFCIAFSVSVAALWSYSLPNADELNALNEMSNRAVVQNPLPDLSLNSPLFTGFQAPRIWSPRVKRHTLFVPDLFIFRTLQHPLDAPRLLT